MVGCFVAGFFVAGCFVAGFFATGLFAAGVWAGGFVPDVRDFFVFFGTGGLPDRVRQGKMLPNCICTEKWVRRLVTGRMDVMTGRRPMPTHRAASAVASLPPLGSNVLAEWETRNP